MKLENSELVVKSLADGLELHQEEVDLLLKNLTSSFLDWQDDEETLKQLSITEGMNETLVSLFDTSNVSNDWRSHNDMSISKLPNVLDADFESKRIPLQAKYYLAEKRLSGIHSISFNSTSKTGIITTLNKIVKESYHGSLFLTVLCQNINIMKQLFDDLISGGLKNMKYSDLKHMDTDLVVAFGSIKKVIEGSAKVNELLTQLKADDRTVVGQEDLFYTMCLLIFMLVWRHKIFFSFTFELDILLRRDFRTGSAFTDISFLVGQVRRTQISKKIIALLEDFTFEATIDSQSLTSKGEVLAGQRKQGLETRRLSFFDDTYSSRLNHFENIVFTIIRDYETYKHAYEVFSALYLYFRGFVSLGIDQNALKDVLDMKQLKDIFNLLQFELEVLTNLNQTASIVHVLHRTKWIQNMVIEIHDFIFNQESPFFSIEAISNYGADFREMGATDLKGDFSFYEIEKIEKRNDTCVMLEQASNKTSLYARHRSELSQNLSLVYQKCNDVFEKLLEQPHILYGNVPTRSYSCIYPSFLESNEAEDKLNSTLLAMAKGIEVVILAPHSIFDARIEYISAIFSFAFGASNLSKDKKIEDINELSRQLVEKVPYDISRLSLGYKVANPKRRLPQLSLELLDQEIVTKDIVLAFILNFMAKNPIYVGNSIEIGSYRAKVQNTIFEPKLDFLRISKYSSNILTEVLPGSIKCSLDFISDSLLSDREFTVKIRQSFGLKGENREVFILDEGRFKHQMTLLSRVMSKMDYFDTLHNLDMTKAFGEDETGKFTLMRAIKRSEVMLDLLTNIFSAPIFKIMAEELRMNILGKLQAKLLRENIDDYGFTKEPIFKRFLKNVIDFNIYLIINDMTYIMHPRVMRDLYDMIFKKISISLWSSN